MKISLFAEKANTAALESINMFFDTNEFMRVSLYFCKARVTFNELMSISIIDAVASVGIF